MIRGLDDFGEFGGRYHHVVKGIRRGHRETRKILFIIEMMWTHNELLQSGSGIPTRVELYKVDVRGFFSLLISGRAEHLRMSDIRLGGDVRNDEFATIIISSVITDQFGQ